MSKKSTNDYLKFISDCSKKSGVKYNEAKKKGSQCNDEYGRLHKKDIKKPKNKEEEETIIFSHKLDEDKKKSLKLEKMALKKLERKPKKEKKPSEWIQYVKKCQQEQGITYKEAMKLCSESYKLQKGKSQLSKRPLPATPKIPFIRPAKKRLDKYKTPEEYLIPALSVTPPEEEIILTLEEEKEEEKERKRIYVPTSYRNYPLEAVPVKYRESERLRRMEEQILYKSNPDIQFSSRVYGGYLGYPDIQNVDLLGKQPHINYYGLKNQPLKLQNPYKGQGLASSAVIIEGLDKSGIFQASKNVLDTLTKKFDEYLDNPSAIREKQIITRIIPDLSYRYDLLKNDLEIFGKSWLPFRIRNHKREMLNIQSKIKSLIMEITGIHNFN